ncbi:rad25/xp-b DNA repair helicase [Anaeramoeba flamelloides]|uniref:DNA 3'-5' helicase n=1 Tax=Anaeramoeba flamelloides TaxID=1746091 RepID=A0AAV7ZBV8_9EUKA|nr:rad25/xp-b DNA repair helicase [Anaeramoeba flamelloides]KAJ6233882.1 rad25/xp-b DNA repair helicase [Anaeramoeba flamelloides]
MFGSGRARSGIIVLPCGAGKTLVGITATCTIQKSGLVICTSTVAVEQWMAEYRRWTNIELSQIARFTSDFKEIFNSQAGIMITTYSMISYTGQRSPEAEEVINHICSRDWGILVLDEVHVVPADIFSRTLTIVKAHTKLGLTATLVREDDKIKDLNYLIGPKLYEANWLDLQRSGYIARVQCAEVWCPLTPSFFYTYLNEESKQKKSLLCYVNPSKFQNCQYLINYHEKRGDKILVFSDNIFALKFFAKTLKRPMIYGDTSPSERMSVLQDFQKNGTYNTVFISKVGDNSIDLPDANVLIQISGHYGSRRQEAQRLGRVLRKKQNYNSDEFSAFFYTLVTQDTREMYFSTKRQQFLIDQGYSFKVVTDFISKEDKKSLKYNTEKDQDHLLRQVIQQDESKGLDEILSEEEEMRQMKKFSSRTFKKRRQRISNNSNRKFRSTILRKKF